MPYFRRPSHILFGGHGRPRTSKGSSIHYIQLYSYHVCKAIVAISDLLATNKLKIQSLNLDHSLSLSYVRSYIACLI